MTPFTVLAALALFTFAPSPPASEPTNPSRQVTAPEHAPQGMESYALLARCQMACDESNATANKERATCKITCLKKYPATPRKYEFVPAPSRAPATNPKREVTTPPTNPSAPATNPKRQTPG